MRLIITKSEKLNTILFFFCVRSGSNTRGELRDGGGQPSATIPSRSFPPRIHHYQPREALRRQPGNNPSLRSHRNSPFNYYTKRSNTTPHQSFFCSAMGGNQHHPSRPCRQYSQGLGRERSDIHSQQIANRNPRARNANPPHGPCRRVARSAD